MLYNSPVPNVPRKLTFCRDRDIQRQTLDFVDCIRLGNLIEEKTKENFKKKKQIY